MIEYLLKSALCLSVLLAAYYLFPAREKMHHFNRFFLLFSLLFGLISPAIMIEIPTGSIPDLPFYKTSALPVQAVEAVSYTVPVQPTVSETASVSYFPLLVAVVYALGALLLLFRFAVNLLKIRYSVSKNLKLDLDGFSLVMLPKQASPHSFLNYIFINEDDYKSGRIEKELLEHELAHIKQLHTADIIFIEVLRIVFWFNPVFILYKKAIQLNHEFLADQAVLSNYQDVHAYQLLLLDEAISVKSLGLVSNWNHSVTGKRLSMMVKKTSILKKGVVQMMVVPVILGLLFSFSIKQVNKETEVSFRSPAIKKEYSEKEIYLKGATIFIKEKGKYVAHYYDKMSPEERQALPAIPALPSKRAPSEELFEVWKANPSDYGLWIDGKRIESNKLRNYRADQFSYFFRQKYSAEFKRIIKVDYNLFLYTHQKYEDEWVKPRSKPGKILWISTGQKRMTMFPPPIIEQVRFPPLIVVPPPAVEKDSLSETKEIENVGVPL